GRHTDTRIHRFTKRGAEIRRILRRDQWQAQDVAPFACHRDADQSTAMRRHEINDLRSNFLSSDGKVAFVFAILVVEYDQDPPGANLLDSLRNRDKRHISMVAHSRTFKPLAHARR